MKKLIEVEVVTGTVIFREGSVEASEIERDAQFVAGPTIAAGTPAAACQALKRWIEGTRIEGKVS